MTWQYNEFYDEYQYTDKFGNILVIVGKFKNWMPNSWQISLLSKLGFLFDQEKDYITLGEIQKKVELIIFEWMKKNLGE